MAPLRLFLWAAFSSLGHWKQPVMPLSSFLQAGPVCAASLEAIASAVGYRYLESNAFLLMPSGKWQPLRHSRGVFWGGEWTSCGCTRVAPKWHQGLSGSFVAQHPLWVCSTGSNMSVRSWSLHTTLPCGSVTQLIHSPASLNTGVGFCSLSFMQ